jgi:hypothetical protein
MARLKAPLWIGALALALWLVIGHGFANYDSLYSLVWGQQVGRGETPQFDLPIAPTPHPLSTLLGVVLSPFSPATAEALLVVLAFVALGALGYLVYRLGTEWYGPPVGLLAAAIILTREPILSYGIRAYVDIPYAVFVLAAVLVEARRPRAGAPVLVLLGLAGLLRPEGWLFSLAYLAWVAPGCSRRELIGLAGLAAAAPVLWALSDLVVTGDPLWSLSKTRDTAQTLRRTTGLENVPETMPRRVGEILREPVLFGAAVGGLATLVWARERARLALSVGGVAVGAFCLLAIAGLPIVTRYLLLVGALLAVFCGAGAFGWRQLDAGDERRLWLMVLGGLVMVALLAFVPNQTDRLTRTFDSLGRQERIRDDLYSLVSHGTVNLRCGPVAVANHRPVPLLALRLHAAPSRIVDAQLEAPITGMYVDPASAEVQRDFTLDKHDPHPLTASVPPGFRFVTANRSWRVFSRCR